jgi:hypothetical protein
MSESFALSAVLRRRKVKNIFVARVIPRARSASALDIFDPHCLGNWKPPSESRQVTGEADYTSLQVDESDSDSESDTTAFMSVAGSRN